MTNDIPSAYIILPQEGLDEQTYNKLASGARKSVQARGWKAVTDPYGTKIVGNYDLILTHPSDLLEVNNELHDFLSNPSFRNTPVMPLAIFTRMTPEMMQEWKDAETQFAAVYQLFANREDD